MAIRPLEPKFEYAMTVTIELDRLYRVRPSAYGSERSFIGIRAGTFEGPAIRGTVLAGSGGDYPWVRPDGVIDFDARYVLQTDDGAMVYLQNRGYRWGPPEVMAAISRREPVALDSYYMRVAPKFEAPDGRYDWLNRYVFVGVADKTPDGNQIHYHKVL